MCGGVSVIGQMQRREGRRKRTFGVGEKEERRGGSVERSGERTAEREQTE